MWPPSSNSTGVYSSGQWSFNPAVYQNIPYEQVDWASLAQQWIKMKETMPSVNQGPPPPPAPQISVKSSSAVVPPTSTPTVIDNQQNDIEGGEAPMDMDTKEDETPGAVGVTPGSNWNHWGNWQSQWGWGWPGNAGTVPLADNTQSASSTADSKVKSQNNDSIPVLKNYISNVSNCPVIRNTGTSIPQVPGSFNYSNTAGGMIPLDLPKSAYWNNNFSSATGKIGTDPWMKMIKINKQQQKIVPAEQFPVMDAAKKKQLPAWIREGLNKMEREKLKKLERERMMQEKLMRDQLKLEERLQEVSEDNLQTFKMTVQNENHAQKSPSPTFNSQYQERYYSPSTDTKPVRPRPSRNIKEDSSTIRKTKDQIMEESMLKVRRILTEILLEATENQVQVIAKEEYRRAKSSASAQQIRKSNALSSLTGNLGLDIYESESESSESGRERDDRRGDSDEELKMAIVRKRREFQRIEDLIEQEIEDKEAKERFVAQQEYDSDNDNDDNESHQDTSNNGTNKSVDKTNYELVHNSREFVKETREQIASSNHGNYRNESQPAVPYKSNLNSEKVNEDKAEKSKLYKMEKAKTKSSSSSSTSTSSASSTRSSSGSSSSSFSNSSSSESERSTSNDSSSRKKNLKHKSKTKGKINTEPKRRGYRSRSRSTSKSKYSLSDKYSVSKSRMTKLSNRKRSNPYGRRSPSYRKRSPSHHKESSEMSRSKRRESSSRRRRRSSSAESRNTRYKRR